MSFKTWLEGAFDDFLGNKQPFEWRPSPTFKVVHVEQDLNVQTPTGTKGLLVTYCLVRFIPPYYDTAGEAEPAELQEIFPVAQFEEKYMKAPYLYGPGREVAGDDIRKWAWREYHSKHNHFHILPEFIKAQVTAMCEEKAQNYLDSLTPERWEAIPDR